MFMHRRGGQNKTAKSSIDATLKLVALPMSRAGVYLFLEKAVLARTANAYQSHGQAERSADLLLTMAVVVVAGVSGGRRVVWQRE